MTKEELYCLDYILQVKDSVAFCTSFHTKFYYFVRH